MCRKTRMCRFYMAGACTKGWTCEFAHGREEMTRAPDLSCTKICPTLLETGVCTAADCKYAHKKEELRTASLERVTRSTNRRDSRDAPPTNGRIPRAAPTQQPTPMRSSAPMLPAGLVIQDLGNWSGQPPPIPVAALEKSRWDWRGESCKFVQCSSQPLGGNPPRAKVGQKFKKNLNFKPKV